MKKNLSTISLALALLSSALGFSQSGKVMPCGTYEAMDMHFASDPKAKVRYEKIQEQLNKAALDYVKAQNKSMAPPVYTIPVVFHVLHQGGPENLPDADLINAVQWVNNDLAKAQLDASLTAAPFSSLYINSEIQLKLAKKDPSGNCINGIVRHIDSKTNWSQASANSAAYWTYTWDPTKYLNIYVVANIISQGTVTGGGQIVGYTYKPGTWGVGDAHDAIVYRWDYLQGAEARSLTHECGHWFNLSHTWGNTNAPGVACGDDNCNDTPPTKGNFTGCPSSLSGNTCPGSGGLDNIQNIMNYSDCPINFTTDQTNRMRTALADNAVGRNNLWSPANLIATDVNGAGNCAPIADFISTTNTYTVCSGSPLIMKSTSYNGTISAYSWATSSGTAATPTGTQTSIVFPTPGSAVVTLTVTNGQGSSTVSKTVTVLDGTSPVPNNYFESFEGGPIPANWQIVNPNGGSVTWEQTTLGAIEGNSSFYINGIANFANHFDYLQMPIINPQLLTNNTVFTFKYAYARASASNNDKFEVQGSKDCGGTWQTIIGLTAATMQNGSGGVSAIPYVPQASEWKTEDIYNHPNWFPYTGYSSVMVRFMFQEDVGGVGFGNRFYLDDIIFSDPNGVNDLTKSISFRMAPNPTTGQANLMFVLSDAANVKVNVMDVTGRNVLPATEYKLQPGEHNIEINKGQQLSKGIYLVNMSVNGAVMSRKLVIE